MSSFRIFPEGWDVTEIKDTNVAIIDGDRGKNYPTKDEFSTEGFCLFLNTGNIKDDVFDFTTCDFITERKDALLRKGKLIRKDIVLTTRGTVGSVAYYHNGVKFDDVRINSGMVILRSGRGLVPEYLYQLFKSPILKTQYQLYSSGAAQPQLPIKDLRRIKLPLPKPDIQKKIAAILSAYDDLIENNRCRIALLEKMAEEIYREWFVRMRFPGHGQAKFEKGAPVGWAPSTLGSIAKFTMGQSPSSEFYNEIGDGLPFHQGVGTYGERFPRTVTYCSEEGRRAHKGDILFSVRAPVGRLNIADREMIIGRGLAAIRHKAEKNSYLYYLLKTAFANEDIIGNGSIFNSVGKDELAKFPIYEPKLGLIEQFDTIASNIDLQIVALTQATERFQLTREALLPRLISGKLDVENLDIQFPPSMAESEPGEA